MDRGTRLFFLLLGVCYFAAFSALLEQFDGLFGEDGVEPVDAFFRRSSIAVGKQASFWRFPSLLPFAPALGLSFEALGQLIVAVGSLSASTMVLGFASLPVALLNWVLYLSVYLCGQTFLSFQWDILLLEVGFLAIWVAPCSLTASSSRLSFRWLLRLCLFKLLFMSGVVKIQANCPTWQNLTALHHHFATQCLPTPFAWLANQTPPLLLRFGVAATLWLEIPGALLLLLPFQLTTNIAIGMQVALQVLIMLTGNYTFFNVLTIALCALQLGSGVRPEVADIDNKDDGNRGEEHWDKRGPLLFLNDTVQAVNVAIDHSAWLQAVCVAFVACFTGVTAACMFQVDAQTGLVLKLSNEQSSELLVSGLPWIVAIGAGGFGVQLSASVAPGGPTRPRVSSPRFGRAGKACKTLSRAVCLSLVMLVGLLWLTLTCGNLFSLAPPLHTALPAAVHHLQTSVRPVPMSNGYGLFRRMTGVGRTRYTEQGVEVPISARPEVIVEGTIDGGSTWVEIPFLYKPGAVDAAPTWVAPYQPRLDWQMWFLALGEYHEHPWFLNFIDKLLEGSADVVRLLDYQRYPFKANKTDVPRVQPLDAIRAWKYEYDFTRLATSWNTDWLNASGATPVKLAVGAWWSRTQKRQFLPAIQRDLPGLVSIIDRMDVRRVTPARRKKLEMERSVCRHPSRAALKGTWWNVAIPVCHLLHFASNVQNMTSRLPRWMPAVGLMSAGILFRKYMLRVGLHSQARNNALAPMFKAKAA